MNEPTVRSVLRILAVVTILLGVIEEIGTICLLASSGPPDGRAAWMLLPPLVKVVAGLLLFAMSAGLARRIVRV
jgi:hypothetical protein